MLKLTPGDLILFQSSCNLGSCCIGCWTRSEIDHVGIVYHGASVVECRTTDGKIVQACYDTPHIVEAMSPYCRAGPLKNVIESRWKGGGNLYWRQIIREPMTGEDAFEGPKGAHTVPAYIPAGRKACSNTSFGFMEKVGNAKGEVNAEKVANFCKGRQVDQHWNYCAENVPRKMSELTEKNKKLPEIDRAYKIHIDVLDEDGNKTLKKKLEDKAEFKNAEGKVQARRLKEKLNYKEWNQSCLDLAGVQYESNFENMVTATVQQDADCWECFFGETCCRRNASADRTTIDESKQKDTQLFCSELVAMQLMRGGWRQGKTESDAYLPKDFTDEPHETLSADLTEGVHYGPQVKIVKTRTRMTPRPDRPEAAGATSEEKKSLIDNGR